MSYTVTITVPATPAQAYAAIIDVRSWWDGDIVGPTDTVGQQFTYRYQDKHRSTHLVSELVPGRRVVWHTTDAELPFADDPREWIGTDIVFDLVPVDGGTAVTFTHVGLTPSLDCYENCSRAWGHFVTAALRQRIAGVPSA